MFLFFTFNKYDECGGANDLIGKAELNTWEALVSLLEENRAYNEDSATKHWRSQDISDNIQVLNLETLEVQKAEILAEKQDDGSWVVRLFEPDDGDEGMLPGIPFEREPKRPVEPTHPPKPATLEEVNYYRIHGSVTVSQALKFFSQEWDRRTFSFTVKRHPNNPLLEKDELRLHAYTVDTYIRHHAQEMDAKHGKGEWKARAYAISCERIDYHPSMKEFEALPEFDSDFRTKLNPNYLEWPAISPKSRR